MGINIRRKREFSAAEKRLAMLRTLFGFVILLSLVTGGAYLIYTLVSEYANYVERRAEDPNVKFVGYRVPHPLSTCIEMRVVFVKLVSLVGSNNGTEISTRKSHDGKLQPFNSTVP